MKERDSNNDDNHDRRPRTTKRGAYTHRSKVSEGGRWLVLSSSKCILTFGKRKARRSGGVACLCLFYACLFPCLLPRKVQRAKVKSNSTARFFHGTGTFGIQVWWFFFFFAFPRFCLLPVFFLFLACCTRKGAPPYGEKKKKKEEIPPSPRVMRISTA